MGIDFEFATRDLLLIDESDSLVFDNPVAFKGALRKCVSISLTATPDDNNRKGAEKQIVDALRLKKF